jgi:hypothetical protein
LLAADMVERIRANPVAASSGHYQLQGRAGATGAGSTQCRDTPCAPTAMAAQDKQTWLESIQHALPGGNGEIASRDGLYVVSVFWQSFGNVATPACTELKPMPAGKACLQLRVAP